MGFLDRFRSKPTSEPPMPELDELEALFRGSRSLGTTSADIDTVLTFLRESREFIAGRAAQGKSLADSLDSIRFLHHFPPYDCDEIRAYGLSQAIGRDTFVPAKEIRAAVASAFRTLPEEREFQNCPPRTVSVPFLTPPTRTRISSTRPEREARACG